ncbi:MAG: radical SAM protein [Actinobacteria bacterium]|nr:radical SAM protein [Actinomycetota bacterium]
MKEARIHVYGPVASRRLGASLGIDLVPLKICNYDCIYCQLGRTKTLTNRMAPYILADTVVGEIKARLDQGVNTDYITIAGSGEPTLNSELQKVISGIKDITEVPVAVLTNGSRLSDPSVSKACLMADLVLPSLDAGNQEVFQKINRPLPELMLKDVVDNMVRFREKYSGLLWLEVMLIEGLNSDDGNIEDIGKLIDIIKPDEVQLNTVMRPPAEPFAHAVDIERIKEIMLMLQPDAPVLIEIASKEALPVSGGSIDEAGLMALLNRRPCTFSQIAEALKINEAEVIKILSRMLADKLIITEDVAGGLFYRTVRIPGENPEEPAGEDRGA